MIFVAINAGGLYIPGRLLPNGIKGHLLILRSEPQTHSKYSENVEWINNPFLGLQDMLKFVSLILTNFYTLRFVFNKNWLLNLEKVIDFGQQVVWIFINSYLESL